MIDGIDYYPKEKKSNGRSKLLVFFLLLLIGALIYWYLDDQKKPEKSKSTLIVISEPVIEQTVETIPIVVTPTQEKQRINQPQILENLDEVTQIYNREMP